MAQDNQTHTQPLQSQRTQFENRSFDEIKYLYDRSCTVLFAMYLMIIWMIIWIIAMALIFTFGLSLKDIKQILDSPILVLIPIATIIVWSAAIIGIFLRTEWGRTIGTIVCCLMTL